MTEQLRHRGPDGEGFYGDDHLAMYINGVQRTDRVSGHHLIDEAARWGLARGRVSEIVRDLLAQDYPRELFALVVVAHNCTDDTADIARAAGACVVELHTTQPGKAQVIRAGARASSSFRRSRTT